MSMSPDFKVRIYDAKDNLKEVRLITLTVWVYALKLEVKGLTHSSGKVSTIVRKFLGCKRNYPVAEMLLRLETSLNDIKRQLGIMNA